MEVVPHSGRRRFATPTRRLCTSIGSLPASLRHKQENGSSMSIHAEGYHPSCDAEVVSTGISCYGHLFPKLRKLCFETALAGIFHHAGPLSSDNSSTARTAPRTSVPKPRFRIVNSEKGEVQVSIRTEYARAHLGMMVTWMEEKGIS